MAASDWQFPPGGAALGGRCGTKPGRGVQVLRSNDCGSRVCACSSRSVRCLALKSDGTVWGWGWNSYGQVGNGTTANYVSVPVQVIGLTNPAAISADYTISLA